MVKIAAALFLALFLAACNTTASDSCAGFKLIRPTTADVSAISPGLVDQILSHNKIGAELCGWKP